MKHDASDPRYAELFRRLRWDDLDPAYLRQLITLAREEDLAGAGLKSLPKHPGDVTTHLLAPDTQGRAALVAREPLVVCALGLVALVLEAYGPAVTFTAQAADGQAVEAGARLGTLEGPVGTLLQAERPLLNFLQHLCGIATQTARYVEALGNSPTRLLDTRKTTPGFRALEKYGVGCGGGWNHRIGLYDRIMLKDNHLAADAAIGDLIARARQQRPDLLVEVEVDNLSQIPPALEAGADIILLDNFTPTELAKAIDLIGEQAYTEASGGITLDNLSQIGALGLDFISSGALTHQSRWRDIGLDWIN